MAFHRNGIDAADSVTLAQSIIAHTFQGRLGAFVGLIYAEDMINNYGWTVSELVSVFTLASQYSSTDAEPIIMEEYPRDIFGNVFDATIKASWQNVAFMEEFGAKIYTWLKSDE